MTIIAGFRCCDGVIVCADTQETVGNLSKRHATKVRVFPEGITFLPHVNSCDLAAAFCGAGEGPFLDMLTRKSWEAASTATSALEASGLVEQTIQETYREYGAIYQQGACPTVELIYGIKMNGESRLFQSYGPVVNEIFGSCSGGSGYYMADFLSARMFSNSLTRHQCVILAVHILAQAKEHVDGCGGDSHIAVLSEDGPSGFIDMTRVDILGKLMNGIDHQLGRVLLSSADLLGNEPLQNSMALLEDLIRLNRNTAQEAVQADVTWQRVLGGAPDVDALGFPLKPPAEEE